jgi:hypothetical protein
VSWQDNDQRIAEVHSCGKEKVKLAITQCAHATTHRLRLIRRLQFAVIMVWSRRRRSSVGGLASAVLAAAHHKE